MNVRDAMTRILALAPGEQALAEMADALGLQLDHVVPAGDVAIRSLNLARYCEAHGLLDELDAVLYHRELSDAVRAVATVLKVPPRKMRLPCPCRLHPGHSPSEST